MTKNKLLGIILTFNNNIQVSAKSSQLKIVYADIQKNITKIILRDTIQLRNSNYFASTLDGINITVQVHKFRLYHISSDLKI